MMIHKYFDMKYNISTTTATATTNIRNSEWGLAKYHKFWSDSERFLFMRQLGWRRLHSKKVTNARWHACGCLLLSTATSILSGLYAEPLGYWGWQTLNIKLSCLWISIRNVWHCGSISLPTYTTNLLKVSALYSQPGHYGCMTTTCQLQLKGNN